jgi:hypothetical protein
MYNTPTHTHALFAAVSTDGAARSVAPPPSDGDGKLEEIDS